MTMHNYTLDNYPLSSEPDGLGYYYVNTPVGQINVRKEESGNWIGIVAGDVVCAVVSKSRAHEMALSAAAFRAGQEVENG